MWAWLLHTHHPRRLVVREKIEKQKTKKTETTEKVVKNLHKIFPQVEFATGFEVNFIVSARIIESRLTVSSQSLAFHKPPLLVQLQC